MRGVIFLNKEIFEGDDKFSNAEQKINQFVLENVEQVQYMSVRELAEKTFTAATSVMRYCKKLGYSGFKDFKINIKNDLSKITYEEYQIRESESAIQVINKMKTLNINVIERTIKLMSIVQLERICEKIQEYKYVDFIAYDANGALADYASHYFFQVGKICNVYKEFDKQVMFSMKADNKEHLVFVITRSGRTNRVIKVLKELHKSKIYSVLVTQEDNKKISHYCTETLKAIFINDFEKMGDCAFYASAKYLLDCIINLYYSKNYKRILQHDRKYNIVYDDKIY